MGEPSAEASGTTEESGGAEAKPQMASKNGKKSEAGTGGSYFTWFMVLALLGVWTSVAVVWFDLVDYQGVVGKLGLYDADNDGDFDMEDVQVLLDADNDSPETFSNLSEEASGWVYGFFSFVYEIMTPFEIEETEEEVSVATEDLAEEHVIKTVAPKDEKPEEVEEPEPKPKRRERSIYRDPTRKLKEALKRQLAMIHERVEAKKIARLAIAELKSAVVKEEEERKAGRAAEAKLEEPLVKTRDRTEAKLLKVVEKMERGEWEEMKAKARREKEKLERSREEEGRKAKKGRDKAEEDKKGDGKGKKKSGEDDGEDDDQTSKKLGKLFKDHGAKAKKSLKDLGKGGEK